MPKILYLIFRAGPPGMPSTTTMCPLCGQLRGQLTAEWTAEWTEKNVKNSSSVTNRAREV